MCAQTSCHFTYWWRNLHTEPPPGWQCCPTVTHWRNTQFVQQIDMSSSTGHHYTRFYTPSRFTPISSSRSGQGGKGMHPHHLQQVSLPPRRRQSQRLQWTEVKYGCFRTDWDRGEK